MKTITKGKTTGTMKSNVDMSSPGEAKGSMNPMKVLPRPKNRRAKGYQESAHPYFACPSASPNNRDSQSRHDPQSLGAISPESPDGQSSRDIPANFSVREIREHFFQWEV